MQCILHKMKVWGEFPCIFSCMHYIDFTSEESVGWVFRVFSALYIPWIFTIQQYIFSTIYSVYIYSAQYRLCIRVCWAAARFTFFLPKVISVCSLLTKICFTYTNKCKHHKSIIFIYSDIKEPSIYVRFHWAHMWQNNQISGIKLTWFIWVEVKGAHNSIQSLVIYIWCYGD